MTKISNFDECLNESNNKKRHLILGNGFSCALKPSIFNYKKLSETILKLKEINPKNKPKYENLERLFQGYNTYDFEYIMRELLGSIKTSQIFNQNKKYEDLIIEKSETLEFLKNVLIDVISKTHPESCQSIDKNEYQSCRNFLEHFKGGRVYTFNYDLLLYWVYTRFLNTNEELPCNDGFRHSNNEEFVEWEIGNEENQNIYYLHGAMHLYSDRSKILKITYSKTGKKLTEQVRSRVDKQEFPIFISEGSTEHKKMRIKSNGYLSRALSSIKRIRGDLFFFGHSLRDEDDHVLEKIIANKGIKKIFISLYGDQNSDQNQFIIQKVERWKDIKDIKDKAKDREYFFFNAESAKVWTSQQDDLEFLS